MRPEARALDRLSEVLDPCSCFTDEPVNIVDLGLVEGVTVEDGTASVRLLLTSPGCTYFPYIARDIEDRLDSIPGVDDVEVTQVTDRVWTRERMDRDVRLSRHERIRRRMERNGIEPYAESTD